MLGKHEDEYSRCGLTEDSQSWNDFDEKDNAPDKSLYCPDCGQTIMQFATLASQLSDAMMRVEVWCPGCGVNMEGYISAREAYEILQKKRDTMVY